jgi:hypothetical protein
MVGGSRHEFGPVFATVVDVASPAEATRASVKAAQNALTARDNRRRHLKHASLE